ncbi:MAG: hypothetical protein ACYTFY_06910 [Planctomycetota bacterium]|jgi:hypothetical protein
MGRQSLIIFSAAGFLLSAYSRKPVYTNSEILLISLPFIIIFVIAGIYLYVKEKQNKEEWQAAGELSGMQEVEDLYDDWEGMFGTSSVDELGIFCGKSCCFKQLFSFEQNNWQLFVGFFQTTVTRIRHNSATNSEFEVQRSVIIGVHTEQNLPYCIARPESFTDKLKEVVFKTEDIDFDEDPEFSSAYLVQGENEDKIRSLLTPKLRRFLLEHKSDKFAFGTTGNSFAILYSKQLQAKMLNHLRSNAIIVSGILDR